MKPNYPMENQSFEPIKIMVMIGLYILSYFSYNCRLTKLKNLTD